MEEADPNFPTNDYIRNKIESERSVFLSGTDAASVAVGAITEETVVTETALVQVGRVGLSAYNFRAGQLLYQNFSLVFT